MEQFGQDLGIYQGGKQAPHTDIAAFFIRRARELYLENPGSDPAIWLVKKSSLRAGQWAAFRELHHDSLVQSVDLEDMQPFGGGDPAGRWSRWRPTEPTRTRGAETPRKDIMIKKLTHALTLASITAMTIGCGSDLAETDEQIIAATEEMLECIDGERERVTEAFIASSSLEAGTAVEMGTTRCLAARGRSLFAEPACSGSLAMSD